MKEPELNLLSEVSTAMPIGLPLYGVVADSRKIGRLYGLIETGQCAVFGKSIHLTKDTCFARNLPTAGALSSVKNPRETGSHIAVAIDQGRKVIEAESQGMLGQLAELFGRCGERTVPWQLHAELEGCAQSFHSNGCRNLITFIERSLPGSFSILSHDSEILEEVTSAVALWEKLSERYTEENIGSLHAQQLAERFVSAFWIRSDKPVRRSRRGEVILSRDVYSEGEGCLSYSSRTTCEKVISALSDVTAEVIDDSPVEIPDVITNSHTKPIQSRRRYELSDHISLVTYKIRFDYIVSPKASEILVPYIAQHGNIS